MSDILSKIQDNMSYNGSVKLFLSSGGGIIKHELKNNGTQHLFDVITQFLAGYDVSNNIPKYIDIFKGEESILKKPIPVTGVVWGPAATENYGEDAIGYLKLTAFIYVDDKVSDETSFDDSSIKLQDKEMNDLCIITSGIQEALKTFWSNINNNTDGIIEWLLKFSN